MKITQKIYILCRTKNEINYNKIDNTCSLKMQEDETFFKPIAIALAKELLHKTLYKNN